MAELEQLKAQVAAARERIGELGESRKAHDERLLGLIESLEHGLAGKQEEIERQQAAIAALQGEKSALEIEMDALEAENGELKSLLASLLSVIDENSADPVAAALDALGKRVAVAPEPADAAPAEAAEAATREEPAPEIEEIDVPDEELTALEQTDSEPPTSDATVGDDAEGDEAEGDLLALEETEALPSAEPGLEIELTETPCSPEMAATIEAVDAAAAEELPEAAGEPELDQAAVLEQIASEVNAVAEGEELPQVFTDDAAPRAPESVEPAQADASEPGSGGLTTSEIEALLKAGAPLAEPGAEASGRPSTVKKIIERVSALAEEMVEDDPEALVKAVAALEGGGDVAPVETAEEAAEEPAEEPADASPEAATGS